jgi:hypothetical protein
MNILKVLVNKYDCKQKHISKKTGITEQRLSYIKTFADEDFEDKTWASEYRRLKQFMDTHTRVCSKTGERMTEGFETECGQCFAHEKDLINWLRNLDYSDPHISDQEYLEWCYYKGIWNYACWHY